MKQQLTASFNDFAASLVVVVARGAVFVFARSEPVLQADVPELVDRAYLP